MATFPNVGAYKKTSEVLYLHTVAGGLLTIDKTAKSGNHARIPTRPAPCIHGL